MPDALIQIIAQSIIWIVVTRRALLPEKITFDWNVNLVEATAAIGTLLAVGVSVGVAVVESNRAKSARRETQTLQVSQQNEQNRRTASLVSAWVTDEYVPNPSKNAFDRVTTLWLSNDADEPVFDVALNIALGDPSYSIGPLAAPRRIPVLPPRKHRSWDISVPLRAHYNSLNARCSVDFTDARNTRWQRKINGILEDVTNRPTVVLEREADPNQELSLGDIESLENPMAVALQFLNLLNLPEKDFDDEALSTYEELLAPEAEGWSASTPNQIRDAFAGGNLASYIDYPAPYVAIARIIADESLGGKTVAGGSVLVDAFFLTLTYAPDRGWRVFGIGGNLEPEKIRLSPGVFD